MRATTSTWFAGYGHEAGPRFAYLFFGSPFFFGGPGVTSADTT